jgi:transposase
VVDGRSIHKAVKVQKRLTALDSKITFLFLPPYSPELNADEWVWKRGKQRITGQCVRTRDDLNRPALVTDPLPSLTQKKRPHIVARVQEKRASLQRFMVRTTAYFS